jgi:hypothetical protein
LRRRGGASAEPFAHCPLARFDVAALGGDGRGVHRLESKAPGSVLPNTPTAASPANHRDAEAYWLHRIFMPRQLHCPGPA